MIPFGRIAFRGRSRGPEPGADQRQLERFVGGVLVQLMLQAFRAFVVDLRRIGGAGRVADQCADVDRADDEEEAGAHQQREDRVDDADDVFALPSNVEEHPPLAACCHQ